jgi:putative membrane protein
LPRWQAAVIGFLVVALAVSVIHPLYPQQMFLQHIPTIAALIGFPFIVRRYPISNATATCLAIFLLLHIVGARYIYSYVPYDQWASAIFGKSINAAFGFRRNHFDRLVHFGFGLLWMLPVREIAARYLKLSRGMSLAIAFGFILAASMLYELFEWGLTITLAPDQADMYNGQQGDMWDAQKDMFAALLGALVAGVILRARDRVRPL